MLAESAQIAADIEHACDGDQPRTMPSGSITPLDLVDQKPKPDVVQNIEIGADIIDLEQGDTTSKPVTQPEVSNLFIRKIEIIVIMKFSFLELGTFFLTIVCFKEEI